MSTQSQSAAQNALSKIFELTREIVEKSATGNCIYRGEPEHYDKVSSALYRRTPDGFDSGEFDLERLQQEILRDARNHIHDQEKKDFELLTELQHYGSQTNLIDFTTDYHIALFFACNGSHDRDGRVIVLQRTEKLDEKYQVKQPPTSLNRVLVQKSIFAQPPNGFIDPNDLIEVNVPANLKQWILIHLRQFQNITTQSIFNDLHGFIKHRDSESSHKAIFPRVLADGIVKEVEEESLTFKEIQQKLQSAISGYTSSIASMLSLRV